MGHAAPLAKWSGKFWQSCDNLLDAKSPVLKGLTALGSSEPWLPSCYHQPFRSYFFDFVQSPFALPLKTQLQIRVNFQVHRWDYQPSSQSSQQKHPCWGKLSRSLPRAVHVTTWFHGGTGEISAACPPKIQSQAAKVCYSAWHDFE